MRCLSLALVVIGPFLLATAAPVPAPEGKTPLRLLKSFDINEVTTIRSLAFAPDGRLAAFSTYSSVRLCAVNTGQELRRFETRGPDVLKEVYGLAFSPDGKRLLVGSGDGLVRLLDTETMQEVRRFEGHKIMVLGVAYAPNGRQVLSCGLDATVRLWDVETGKEVRRFEGHKGPVWAVAFSPDGRFALTGGGLERVKTTFQSTHLEFEDTMLRLWDLATGKEVRRFEGHEGTVLCATFSPDGREVMSGGKDRLVRTWDIQTGKQKFVIFNDQPSTSMQVHAVAYSPDGRRALVADQTSFRLLDPVAGRELSRVYEEELPLWSVAFSPDGKCALSNFRRGLRLWQLPEK